MREGTVVPESAIPASAWGISCQVPTAEQIAAADPFGGNGVRLEIPPGVEVSIEDIQQATGLTHVVLFPDGGVAWAERDPGISGIAIRWLHWLASNRAYPGRSSRAPSPPEG